MSYFDGIGMNAANPLGGTDGDKIAFVNVHRNYTNAASGHETEYTPIFTAGYGIDDDSSTKSRLPAPGSGAGDSGSDSLDYIAHAKFSKLSLVSEIRGLSSSDMNDTNRATADTVSGSIFKPGASASVDNGATNCVLTINSEGLVYAVPKSEIATPFSGVLSGNLTVDGSFIHLIKDTIKWTMHHDTNEFIFRYYADSSSTSNFRALRIHSNGTLNCTNLTCSSGQIQGASLDINGNADISGNITCHGLFTANGETLKLGNQATDNVFIPGNLYIGASTIIDGHNHYSTQSLLVKSNGDLSVTGHINVNDGHSILFRKTQANTDEEATNYWACRKVNNDMIFVKEGFTDGTFSIEGELVTDSINTGSGQIKGGEIEGTSLDINGNCILGNTTNNNVFIPGSLYIGAGETTAGHNLISTTSCKINYYGEIEANADIKIYDGHSLKFYKSTTTSALGSIWNIYQTTSDNLSIKYNNVEKLSLRDEGQLCIHDSVESGKQGTASGGFKMYSENQETSLGFNTGYKTFKVGVHEYTVNNAMGTFNFTALGFYEGTSIKGYINTNGPYIDATFTGQHRCISEGISDITNMKGYIVSATNKYRHLNSNSKNKIKNILINESVPEVLITIKQKDKKVFGVISDEEDKEKDTREHSTGAFVSVINKNKNDNRLYINSLGEGAIWVSDINGSIENGDYITSSDIPGIGMKQDAEMLMNYTVAKITMDCEFNPVMEQSMVYNKETEQYEPEKNENGHNIMLPEYEMKYIKLDGTIINKVDYELLKGQEQPVYKMAFVGCTYHCG